MGNADHDDGYLNALKKAIEADDSSLQPDFVSTESYLKMEKETLIDPLTGLANDRAFQQRFNEFKKSQGTGGLLILDANNLKDVNDIYGGHDVGDYFLQTIAGGLRQNLDAEKSFVARLHSRGDEFAILLPGVDEETMNHITERLTSIFSGGFDKEGHLVPTMTIGSVHTNDIDRDYNHMMACADYSLYQSQEKAAKAPPVIDIHPITGKEYHIRKPTISTLFDLQQDGLPKTIPHKLLRLQSASNA